MRAEPQKLQGVGGGRFTDWFFYAITILAVAGAFYTFFIAGIPEQATFYSVLILKPGSYSHYADSNTASFSFTIKNVEGADAVYSIKYLANGTEMGSEQLEVADGGEKEFSKTLDLGNGFEYPIKVEVWAEANGKTYSIFYWLKENG